MEVINVWWKRTDGTFFFGDGYTTSTEYTLATEAEITQIITEHSALEAILLKWEQVKTQWNALTVTTTLGNIYNASFASISAMKVRLDSMPTSSSTIKWYEDWATYTVTKTELQEAYDKASIANQSLLDLKMA